MITNLLSQCTESHVTVDVYRRTTIATVTAVVLKKAEGTSSRKYKVFNNENELENHMTLLDCHICDQDTLYLKRILKLFITITKTPHEGILISQL